MRILQHIRNLPAGARSAVAALGNFDGVHRGHQALIAEAKRLALAAKRPLAAVVFEPYPREFFRPGEEPFRLTPLGAKAHLLDKLGVDLLVVLTFDKAMAAMSAQDFVLDVLVKKLGIRHAVIGRDFLFGHGRAGDAAVLAYMGEMEGFGVSVLAPVAADAGGKISSSDIRAALKQGRPADAARLLGHWWTVEGEVIVGDKRGRAIGFPTANLKPQGMLHPAFGIYAVRARLEGSEARHYDGVASFGIRPMFEAKEPLLEVFLFDFAGDLYRKRLAVEFVAYLRPEAKFAGLDALKHQMTADCAQAKRLLAGADERAPPLDR